MEVVEDFVGEEVVVVVARKSPWERAIAFDSFERKLDQRGVRTPRESGIRSDGGERRK